MLFERDDELAHLLDLARDMTRSNGQLVTISGEAGIGKSSLLRAFTQQIDEKNDCVWGMCDALFTPRPLGPLHDILEMLPDLETDRRLEAGVELFPRLLSYFSNLSAPMVLIIEDVHWADNGTLDFIRFLGRRITLCPVLFIITYRDDELGRDHPLTRILGDLPNDQLHRIGLKPLSMESVKQMASGDVDPTSLMQITGGNPFFVSEILADGSDKSRRVPESVQDAVNSRLSRLDEAHRLMLEKLSIIAVPIDPELHCSEIENSERWIAASLSVGILQEESDGKLRFRHELARRATASRFSSIELRSLHKRHLDILMVSPEKYSFAELMHHAKGAADATAIMRYAPAAAENAARLGAHREAAGYLEAALQYIDIADTQEAAEIYEAWAYESSISNQIDDRVLEATRHALTLWRAIGRSDKIAENLRSLSRLHWYRGESAQANRYLDEAVKLFERLQDDGKLALAYSMRSQMMMLNSHMEEAISWGERALTKAGETEASDVRVHALNNIGTAKLFLGDKTGIDDLQQSLSLAISKNLHEDAARVYTNLSEYAVDIRDLELAEKTIADGVAFDTKHDLDSWTYYLLGRKVQLRLEQGRLEEAVSIAQEVIETEGQTLLMRLPARIMLARAQLRLADKEAIKTLEQARHDALETGEVQYQIPILLGFLEKAWLSGAAAVVDDAMFALGKIDIERFSVWTKGEYAFWAKLLNRPTGLSSNKPLTSFDDAVEGHYEKAGDKFADAGANYLANICYGLSAKPSLVSQALTSLREQKADAAVARLIDAAETRGIGRDRLKIPRGPYNASRQNSLGLTAKEQVVLKLLGEGLSNGEIAENLSRSPRTIEHHVSSILQKMNVENRMAAVLKLKDEPGHLGISKRHDGN